MRPGAAWKEQARPLVDARDRGDLAERHRRRVGMERVEHGKRAFDRLDLIFAHPGHPLSCPIRSIVERSCAVQNVMLRRKIFCCTEQAGAGMAGLLAATRVLDLTNVLAGPFCCYQLAQLGAEVIKVEVPGSGDLARQLGADPALNRRGMGASFLAQNAGKRSLTLNLKSPKGREAFSRLVASADVVVENFRPGVMERLGLGYAALKAVKSDLVYCAISGFGQDGPLRFNPAYDQIIQGLCGVMSVTGDAQSAPLRVGYPVADTMGGVPAAFAFAAALVRRERTGEGEFIDVSMLEASLVAMGWAVSNWLVAGVKPQPMGNENMTAAPSGTFRTGDGLLNIAANKQEQFEALVKAVGCEALATDPRFAERESRKKNRKALTDALETCLAKRGAVEWEGILNKIGVPA